MKARSIIQQLLYSTLLLVLVFWTAMVLSVGWVIKHETDEIFDSSLQETAQRLLPLAVMQLRSARPQAGTATPAPLMHLSDDAIEPLGHKEYLVYQVFNASGTMLMRSHMAPQTPLITALRPGFQASAPYLSYVEMSRNGEFFLVLAEHSSHRADTLTSMAKFLLLPLLALLPLTALGTLLIARRAGRALAALNLEIARRGHADLNPLETSAFPKELQPLAATLNQLMHRLQLALEAERNFAANSAHELRTPLAAALAQLSMLEHAGLGPQQHQTVDTIKALLLRLQALSEKLLQLARAESGIAWKHGDVDLSQLLQLLCQDQQWRARLPIVLDLPATPVHVQGDVDALGIILNNLLENAIKYSTPDSTVTVRLQTGPLQISISNDCDALPAALLARLHERFFRLKPDANGAGLGLSIVHALLAPSGISLKLSSPIAASTRGFEARLSWPEQA